MRQTEVVVGEGDSRVVHIIHHTTRTGGNPVERDQMRKMIPQDWWDTLKAIRVRHAAARKRSSLHMQDKTWKHGTWVLPLS